MPETKEKPGVLSSAFLATAPLAGAMLTAALTLELSDGVRVVLICAAAAVQLGYVLGNAIVKAKK